MTGELQNIAFDSSLPAVEVESKKEDAGTIELPVLLEWQGNEPLTYSARSCNGCGRCRSGASSERMCPMFRVHKGEEASPRAKANLLRGMLTAAWIRLCWKAAR